MVLRYNFIKLQQHESEKSLLQINFIHTVTISEDPTNESMTFPVWDGDTGRRRLASDSRLRSSLHDHSGRPAVYNMTSLARFEAGPCCSRMDPVHPIHSAGLPPKKPLRRKSFVSSGGYSTEPSCSLDQSTTCWHCIKANDRRPSGAEFVAIHPPRLPSRQSTLDSKLMDHLKVSSSSPDFRSIRPPTKPVRQRTAELLDQSEPGFRAMRTKNQKAHRASRGRATDHRPEIYF